MTCDRCVRTMSVPVRVVAQRRTCTYGGEPLMVPPEIEAMFIGLAEGAETRNNALLWREPFTVEP